MLRWMYSQKLEAIAEKEEYRSCFEESLSRGQWKEPMGLAKGHTMAIEHQHLHRRSVAVAFNGQWLITE